MRTPQFLPLRSANCLAELISERSERQRRAENNAERGPLPDERVAVWAEEVLTRERALQPGPSGAQ